MVKKRDESRISRFLAWALGGRLNTEQLFHGGKFLKAATRFRKVTCHSLRQPHKLDFCVDILNVFLFFLLLHLQVRVNAPWICKHRM